MESKKAITQWELQKGWFTMFVAEIVGTAILLFIGCMACIAKVGQAPSPPMHMSIGFGMTVNLIIMMLGHISGAHLNPAVTIGAVILGIKNLATGAIYIIAQFIGASVGYALLMSVTPDEFVNTSIDPNPICLTVVHRAISTVQAIIIEILCTSFILLGACATWDRRCAHTTDSTALRFGFSVTAISFAAGPYTGCSMNPARSFGPALWHNAWQDQWIYWFGPVAGALLGTYIYIFMFAEIEDKKRIINPVIVSLKGSIEDCLNGSNIFKGDTHGIEDNEIVTCLE